MVKKKPVQKRVLKPREPKKDYNEALKPIAESNAKEAKMKNLNGPILGKPKKLKLPKRIPTFK